MLALQALTTTGGREYEAFNVISITGMAHPSDGSHSISEKYQRIHTREECLPLSQDAFGCNEWSEIYWKQLGRSLGCYSRFTVCR